MDRVKSSDMQNVVQLKTTMDFKFKNLKIIIIIKLHCY